MYYDHVKSTSKVRIVVAVIGIILCVIGLYNESRIIIDPTHKGALCSLSETFDCSKAALSPYAKFLGIPTAGWGASYYLAMIVLEGVPAILFLLSATAVVASIYLFWVSVTVLHVICPICFSEYIVNIILFALSFSGLRQLSTLKEELVALYGAKINRTVITIIGALTFLSASFMFIQAAHTKSADSVGLSSFVKEWKQASFSDIPVRTTGILKDAYKGNPDAKVTVVEFLDFECPACRAVSAEFQPFFEAKKDKIRLLYKNYPLDRACNPSIMQEMHANACFTAELARCAGEQGKYWQAAELMLSIPLDQKGPIFQAEILTDAKEKLSLDSEGMNECLRSHRQLEAIKEDMKLAEAVGIMGTPTFFVNGKKVPANSPQIVNAVIEAAIAGQ